MATTVQVGLTDEQADAFQQEWPATVTPDRPYYAACLIIANAIRAAWAASRQTFRMPEPAWGEKVIAHTADTPDRRQFLHIYGTQGGDQYQSPLGGNYGWDQLINPEPWRADA